MGYSIDDSIVRVDFFKESGKWHCSEAVKWTGGWDSRIDIMEAFETSLQDHFRNDSNRLSDMDAVCIHPYHEWAYPVCIKNGEWRK